MRINSLLFFSCVLLSGCREAGTPRTSSYIKTIVDSLDIDKSKNILIYTINPNDCLSCINGFKSMNTNLAANGSGRLYIVSVERVIEKQELLKKITDIDLLPEKNKSVLWSKEVFSKVNHVTGKDFPISAVSVFNYARDTILYSRPIREVSNYEDLVNTLKTIP